MVIVIHAVHIVDVDIVLAMAEMIMVLLRPTKYYPTASAHHTCTRHRTAEKLRLCDFLNCVDR